MSQEIPAWIRAHDLVLEYPFTQLVSGHLSRFSTREDVLAQRGYMRDLVANTRAAIAAVKLEDVVAGVPDSSNTWLLLDTYLNTMVQQATDATLETWRSRLGGADIYIFSNASTIVESLRTDYGVLGSLGIRP